MEYSSDRLCFTKKYVYSEQSEKKVGISCSFELLSCLPCCWQRENIVILIWFNWNTHKISRLESSRRSWNIHFSSHQESIAVSQTKTQSGWVKFSYIYIFLYISTLTLCYALSHWHVIMILEHHKTVPFTRFVEQHITYSMWIKFNIEYMKAHIFSPIYISLKPSCSYIEKLILESTKLHCTHKSIISLSYCAVLSFPYIYGAK